MFHDRIMTQSSFMKMFNLIPSQKSKQTSSEIGALIQSKSKLFNLIGDFSYSSKNNLLILHLDDGEQVRISTESSPKKILKLSHMGKVYNFTSEKDLFDYLWKIKVGKI